MTVRIMKGTMAKNWPWICTIIVYNVLFACIYAHYKTESVVDNEITLQMSSALSHMGLGLFSKDYLFHNPGALGFYSPQQIYTLKWLYMLFKDFSIPLAAMSLLYGLPMAIISYCFARRVGFTPLVSFLMSFMLCVFATDPVSTGNYWGFYRTYIYKLDLPFVPYAAYMPYNWSLASSMYLLLLYCIFFNLESERQYYLFSFLAGVLFLIHAPTGLTFIAGASIMLLWCTTQKGRAGVGFLMKCGAFFLIGASPFLVNYFMNVPHAQPLSSAENKFLYDFWQYRFPDDYPRPIWKLLIRGFPSIGWLAHVPPILLTGLGIWAWVRKNIKGQIGFIYGVLFYVFVFKSVPYALFGLLLVHAVPAARLERWELPLKRLFLLTFGLFFVTTWGQLSMDVYYRLVQRPPFIIDNTRFVPYLAANAFLITALLLHEWWAVTGSSRRMRAAVVAGFVFSTFVIATMYEAPRLREWAQRHNVFYRAQYNGDEEFYVDDEDYAKILSFAKTTPVDSLFIFLDSDNKSWYLRFRARRSIGINLSDMGVKYYMLKNEIHHDWDVFTKLVSDYAERNTEDAVRIASNLGADYLVFPKTAENQLMALESGKSYVILPIIARYDLR